MTPIARRGVSRPNFPLWAPTMFDGRQTMAEFPRRSATHDR